MHNSINNIIVMITFVFTAIRLKQNVVLVSFITNASEILVYYIYQNKVTLAANDSVKSVAFVDYRVTIDNLLRMPARDECDVIVL